MSETTWFWVGAGGMALGAVALGVLGGRRTQDEEGHTLIHVLVPVVAALAYFSMAVGQGVTTAGGRELTFARYLDWSVTTPLLLLGLAMTALHGAHRRPGLVAALLGADVLMIVTGAFFAASAGGAPKWTWFAISCGFFVAVYATLLGPLLREAGDRDPERRSAYRRSLAVLAGLWLVYPVLDVLGQSGTGVWTPTTTTACFTVLDLLAKVGYGLLVTRDAARVATHDLAAGDVTEAPVASHPAPSGQGPTVPATRSAS